MTSEDFFAGNINPRFCQSISGRMDVMGGIGEYSGALVLSTLIRESATIILTSRNDRTIRVYNQIHQQAGQIVYTEIDLLLKSDNSIDRAALKELSQNQYPVNYLFVCLSVLHSRRESIITGIDIYLQSQIPEHVGLGSKEAIVTAFLKALADAYQLVFTDSELPILVWEVLQLFKTHYTPLADSLSCYFGIADHILPILCQPDHISPSFGIPDGIGFAGITTGGISNNIYALSDQIRTAASIGYTMISLFDGTYPHELEITQQTGDRENLLYNGYLANITPLEFESRYKWLPKYVKGSVFLEKSGILIDPALSIEPDTHYPVFQATAHPIYENVRTQYFSLLLQHLPPVDDIERREKSLQQLGNWMFQSYDSYSHLNLNNKQSHALIQLVRDYMGKGVYGARITDQGAGSTVCILWAGHEGQNVVQHIYEQYQQQNSSARLFW